MSEDRVDATVPVAVSKARASLLEARSVEVYCGAFYGPPLPPIGEPGECGHTFTVEMDDPVEPTRWVRCPRCGAECEVEW